MKALETLRRIALALAAVLAVSCPAYGSDTWEELIPGVQHLHRVTSGSSAWNIHVIKADLANPRVRVRTIIKNDHDYPDPGERTSSMAQRYSAVAAINTDFFCATGCETVWHCPQGYTVTDGLNQLPYGYSSPINPYRTTFQISKTQTQVVVNTVSSPQSWWYNVAAGGPRLVRNGQVSVESEPDVPDQTSRQPRTACAISADGRYLIMATVDGRQPGFSVGMTGAEMAALLLEMGGYQGMGFDGGGSTTMAINGSVANSPSDGSERYVAASLAIIDAFAQPSEPACWFDTGFDNPPYPPGPLCGVDGWTCESGQPVIAAVSSGFTTQAVSFADSAAWRNVTSSPVGGVQWIDCSVRASAWPVDGVLEVGSAPSTGAAALIAFRPNGKISYFEGNRSGGGTWKDTVTYFPDRWYRICLRNDYQAQSYSFYLDGYLRASGVPFRDSTASTGLRSVRVADSTGAGGEFHVDGIYAGNVDPWFPRVQPNSARIVVPGPKQFSLLNGPASGWQVIDERNPDMSPATPGSIATINASGLASVHSAGSFRVRALDAVGKADESAAMTAVQPQQLGDVRSAVPGTAVDVSGLIVTGAFDGFFYAQTADRSVGILIVSSVPVSAGDIVSVTGTVSFLDGELAIAASWVEDTDSAQVPDPLLVLCRDVARQDPGGPSASVGSSIAALLVTAAGRIQSVEANRFLLDDGSATQTPVIYSGLTTSDVGKFVVVKGLVGLSQGVPAIRTRSASDVTFTSE